MGIHQHQQWHTTLADVQPAAAQFAQALTSCLSERADSFKQLNHFFQPRRPGFTHNTRGSPKKKCLQSCTRLFNAVPATQAHTTHNTNIGVGCAKRGASGCAPCRGRRGP